MGQWRGPEDRPAPLRRKRRWLAGMVGLLIAAFLAASCMLFVWPATDQPRHVDGILSLNGTDEVARQAKAVTLAEEGYAPVLLFSRGNVSGPCPRVRAVKVVCFVPSPQRTVGEVRFAATYARQHGWHSLMVVAGRAQVTRARLLMGRCFSGRVLLVAANFQLPHFPFEVAYEWGALGKALLVDRQC